jgi:hypothetical protein
MRSIRNVIKNILIESAGISFEVRAWSDVIYNLLKNNVGDELIVEGQDYPEIFEKFSVDYFVIDFNPRLNGYLNQTSGYDKDGNYVVHILILDKLKGNPYIKTVLNHEIKHAYQDWQRISKGYPNIDSTKEVINMYTRDFIKVINNETRIGDFFKYILKGYYLLSDLELDAFMENVYDRDVLNNYRKMISDLRSFDISKPLSYTDPNNLDNDWESLLKMDIPFLKKYKNYNSFLKKSNDYFKTRSEEIIRKLNKMEYVHRER